MSAVLHLLGELAAATPVPTPSPTVAPAAPVEVKVGETGEWFGPTVFVIVSLLIDATAAGASAKRDRLAAVGSYVATLGFISIYGWSETIQGWFGGSWSWQLTGSAIALLAHLAFVAVLLGDKTKATKRIGTWLGGKVGFDSEAGNAVGRINTKLHAYAAAAACTYVLARGDFAAVPHTIGKVLTGAGAIFVNWLIDRLGG